MALPAPQSVTATVPGGGKWSTFDVSVFYDASPGCSFGTCPSGSSTVLTPSSGMLGLPAGTHFAALTVRADSCVPTGIAVILGDGVSLVDEPEGHVPNAHSAVAS
jgi:hypothetical protein